MLGREVAVLRAEIALQLDGIARAQRHDGLQPDGGGQRDMGGGAFAEGATDFRAAVRREPPTHPGRRAGVDFVEQCRTEEVFEDPFGARLLRQSIATNTDEYSSR